MDTYHNDDISVKGAILFVDDELSLLHSLKRVFFDTEIEVFIAQSKDEVIEILKKRPVDIIISDYRMPKIDGMQLLQFVKKEYPMIYRILFSGFIDNSILRRALGAGWASAYFTKPWNNAQLKSKIINLFKSIASIKTDLFMKLNSITYLPVPVQIFHECIDAIQMDKTKTEIIEVIKTNSALSLKILQVANSFLLKESDIFTIEESVNILKLSGIRDIVLNIDLVEYRDWNDENIAHLKKLNFRSILINKYLPKLYQLIIGKKLPSYYSSLGFVLNCGELICLEFFPEVYNKACHLIPEMNREHFFMTGSITLNSKLLQSNLGSYLLSLWNLPSLFINILYYRDKFNTAPEKIKNIIRIINYTDNLIRLLLSETHELPADIASLCPENVPIQELEKIFNMIKKELKNN